MTYSPQLLAAVAVLDKDKPGWHRSIDLDTFNLFDNHACVIGQVYGAGDGNEIMAKVVSLGANPLLFCPGPGFFERDTNTPQWRALISARQAADQHLHDTLAVNDERYDHIEGVAV